MNDTFKVKSSAILLSVLVRKIAYTYNISHTRTCKQLGNSCTPTHARMHVLAHKHTHTHTNTHTHTHTHTHLCFIKALFCIIRVRYLNGLGRVRGLRALYKIIGVVLDCPVN